jgi:uncharacterized membrane protein YvlD (DUF360 family)
VANTIEGFRTSDQLSHWIMMCVLFSIALSLTKPLIKFLTLPTKFFFYWIVGAALSFGAFYGMKFLLPGISFSETVIDGKSLGIVSINPATLSPTLTMIIGSLYASAVKSVLYWLKKA